MAKTTRAMVRRVQNALAARAGGALVTGIMRSVEPELILGAETEREFVRAQKPAIYVLWHGRLLPCAWNYRHLGLRTLISRNRDGDHITGMIQRWGFGVIRGSSSRGATGAQMGIVRALREGASVALTPDGPRGPRQKMKLGPIRAAMATGVPIIPVSAGAAAGWYFGRWDRFLVPRPFTWVPVALGRPIWTGEPSSEEDVEEVAARVEMALNNLTEIVDDAARLGRGRVVKGG
jgi:lysophospholipid acyltransferase (LPLAT)-like uncharacterized protein